VETTEIIFYQLLVDPVLLVKLQWAMKFTGQLLLINISIQVIHVVYYHHLQ